ncbi:hypothetical protein M422DRAFT_773992 [Sphaerobolus stellatus SS14]|nr:hypothetical protein M422DRAFT_773992 [Sphaerobolus stellatus SS14]
MEKLMTLWKATYRSLVALINDIPNLQYMAFHETGSAWALTEPPFPAKFPARYELSIRSQYLEYQLGDVRSTSAEFVVPNFVEPRLILDGVGERAADMDLYLKDILDSASFPLVSAKIHTLFITSLSSSMITKFESIYRMSIAFLHNGYYDNLDYTNIQNLFANIPKLRQLHIGPYEHSAKRLVILTDSMPNLESFMGPEELWPLFTRGRSIHELYRLQGPPRLHSEPSASISKLERFTADSRLNNHILDLSPLPVVSEEHITTLSILLPNLEVLGSRCDRSKHQSLLVYYLDAVSAFRRLKQLHILCLGAVSATVPDIKSLPAPFHHHPSPLLDEIRFISVCTARWHPDLGWNYYPYCMETTVSSHACELDHHDELWPMIDDHLDAGS